MLDLEVTYSGDKYEEFKRIRKLRKVRRAEGILFRLLYCPLSKEFISSLDKKIVEISSALLIS